MSAANLNFDGRQVQACEQGATFSFVWSWEDSEGVKVDLSTFAGIRMQVRKNYGGTLIVELTTANGRITIDSNEDVTLQLTATETTTLPPGNYVYDLEVENVDGTVYRLIEGQFKITPEVTV